jgi:formate dehydrogenase subunit gamma
MVKHCSVKPMEHGLKLLSLLMLFFMLAVSQQGYAAEDDKFQGVIIKDPGSDLWREVRQRNTFIDGVSQVKSVDANILINPQADKWTRFRVGTLVNYASIILAGIALLLLAFYLLRGKLKVEGGLSGRMVHRFSDYERILHWTLAIIFLFLAVTGLMLLLGRTLLIPLFGHEFFSLLASSSKEGHNLFGPIFFASLVMMLLQFVKRNIYEKGDLTWLLKGGGIIGKSHVSGGFFNMGEKTWYWMVILIGLVISISGFILVSPNFGQGRVIMELSHVVHVIAAIILIAVSFGHMYMGSVGTEGTPEGMKTGYVDINWAESHHDRWAKQCHENDLIISTEEYQRKQGGALNNANTMAEENK